MKAMAHRSARGGSLTDHGDGKRVYSAILAHLHPQLPKHRRKKSRKPLAASLADLGVDLRKLSTGRHSFSCRQCQSHRRTATMLVVVTGASTSWNCRGCGEAGGFSFGVCRGRDQRALP
jgi:hypothetical protein